MLKDFDIKSCLAEVNDVHSRLNRTSTSAIMRPDNKEELAFCLDFAKQSGMSLATCGGRHAMGGQQFLSGALLADARALNRILDLDLESGILTVEAGIFWSELVTGLADLQRFEKSPWVIKQKPTGADDITVGGSVSSNAHGRGLTLKPIVGDIESLEVLTPDGTFQTASRNLNRELFMRVTGGYGTFGIIYSVKLRLVRLGSLRRLVEITTADELAERFESKIAAGSLYGDFQFAIDNQSNDFLYKGILSCYEPVEENMSEPANNRVLDRAQWRELVELAHSSKSEAFSRYSHHYLKTNGQIYPADTFQLSTYVSDYHRELDKHSGSGASEIISELYVPRCHLRSFLKEAARFCRAENTNIIYGTIRMIEKDDETLIPWARDRYACIIFNLHTEHTAGGIQASSRAFRHLIDLAIERGGSFYLTYHRFAQRRQIEAAYPAFPAYLEEKSRIDPEYVLDSDWLRHMRRLFI